MNTIYSKYTHYVDNEQILFDEKRIFFEKFNFSLFFLEILRTIESPLKSASNQKSSDSNESKTMQFVIVRNIHSYKMQ